MNITILGATGSMGREIASQLIRSRLLARQEILQLGGNPSNEPESWDKLQGIKRDFQDAFAEMIPEIDTILHPHDVIGDIVVVAGGKNLPTDRKRVIEANRRTLRPFAKEVCDLYARSIPAQLLGLAGKSPPIFLIVTNPVEFTVERFAQALDELFPNRGFRYVIGMGAHNDSLRFQWEIAHDIGVSRDRVSASVFGEHGPLMVPRWSSIKVLGMSDSEVGNRIRAIFNRDKGEGNGNDLSQFFDVYKQRHTSLKNDIANEKITMETVLTTIERYRPDFRVGLKPFAIHFTNSKTAQATGAATVRLLRALIQGEPYVPVVQRMVETPNGRRFAYGLPMLLSGLLYQDRTIRNAQAGNAIPFDDPNIEAFTTPTFDKDSWRREFEEKEIKLLETSADEMRRISETEPQ